MKNKLIVGALSGLLILGGAIAVGASKNDTRLEDSIHNDDKKVEIETEHGQTEIRAKANDGAHQDKHSGDDDNKAVEGAHQNKHSGDDDNKAVEGAHQNKHSGDDDKKIDDGGHQNNKADDGAHQNRHSGDDDK